MTLRYEVRWFDQRTDKVRSEEIGDRDKAIEYAKQVMQYIPVDQVEIIKWSVEHNLPGCKPDLVYRSCSLSVLKPDGKWYGHTIHDPHCIAYVIDEKDI